MVPACPLHPPPVEVLSLILNNNNYYFVKVSLICEPSLKNHFMGLMINLI